MRTTEVATLAGDGDQLFRAQRWAEANLDERRVIANPYGRGWSREWTGREALAYIAYRKTLRLLLGVEGRRGGSTGESRLADRVAALVRFRVAPLDQAWYFENADSLPTFCSLDVAADLIFENGGVVLPIAVWAGLEERAVAA